MSGYAGKIKPGGTQIVKAPYGGGGHKKGTVKETGSDLRNKNKSGK